MIKEYFANYFLHMSDVTFHIAENRMEVHRESAEPLAGDPGRHRREHHDRRTPEAGPVPRGRRGDFRPDLWRRRLRHRHHRRTGLPPAPMAANATVAGVRPPKRFGALDIEGEPGHDVPGEARGRRRLDQRRLLPDVAQGGRSDRGRFHHLGALAARNPGPQRSAARLHPPRLLAAHGHPAR
ncbi:MAG: hypothetical protein WDN45_17380 [Caulobacteraceae bacterium]